MGIELYERKVKRKAELSAKETGMIGREERKEWKTESREKNQREKKREIECWVWKQKKNKLV